MRKTWTVIGIVLVVILAIGGVAMSAHQAKQTGSIQIKSDDEAGYAGEAKISFDSAVNAALQSVPGKVLKAELENENGYLVYGVEVAKADHQIADVKIDAGNGKVLKIETDQKDDEGHEGEDSDNGHEEGGER
jgi:uncharacterized membrane protein YkoI